jgi:polyisoprenyl-phosphate glycosyltransferase
MKDMENEALASCGQDAGERMDEPAAWLLIPVFNDWDALATLLDRINRLETCWRFRVLLVNDSPLAPPRGWFSPPGAGTLRDVRVLHLRRNTGHQRAIALGLCFWQRNSFNGPVVVMDADGEDRPEDVLRLLAEGERHGWTRVVFAARHKRSENRVYRTGYVVYRHVHRLLTGMSVRFGNFSVLSRAQIAVLVHLPDLWNHYANAVLRSKCAYGAISTSRGHRLAGKSSMNLAGWVAHGLSALAMFSDVIGTRVLLVCTGGAVLSGLLAGVSGLTLRMSSHPAPFWMFWAALAVLAVSVQAIAVTVLFLLLVLGRRTQAEFLPVRDSGSLTGPEEIVWRR